MTEAAYATSNLLLSAMNPADRELLGPGTSVTLQIGDVLAAAHQHIEYVYFLEGGVATELAGIGGSVSPAEIGIIGCEGVTSQAVLLGSNRSPQEILFQVSPATARRYEAELVKAAMLRSGTLSSLLLRDVHTFVAQLASSALANGHHRMEVRLARWILMCHDRVADDRFELTHGLMAKMIDAQRSGVTNALHVLEGEKAIRSTRGAVRVLDRAKLVEFADGTYDIAEAEYRRLIGPFGKNE